MFHKMINLYIDKSLIFKKGESTVIIKNKKESFVKTLKSYTNKNNVSYKELADELNVSHRTVLIWLNKKRSPSRKSLIKLTELLLKKKLSQRESKTK